MLIPNVCTHIVTRDKLLVLVTTTGYGDREEIPGAGRMVLRDGWPG